MLHKTFTIQNKLGIHARAAMKLVKLASCYQSSISITNDGRQVNAKSILGVMALGVSKGMEIELEVAGEDEEIVLLEIEKLINNYFDESE